MSKVIILRGIPGSGKSTWVDNYIEDTMESLAVVNVLSRDKIRAEQFGDANTGFGVDEELVTRLFFEEYENLLKSATGPYSRHIIIDNTNIFWDHVLELADLAYEYDIPVETVLIDVGLDEALWRNAGRDRVVPEEVIRGMHTQLEFTKEWSL
jgi:predicted kinase